MFIDTQRQKEIQLLPHVKASGTHAGDGTAGADDTAESHTTSSTTPPTDAGDLAPPTVAGDLAPPTSDVNRVPETADSRSLSSFVKLSRAVATWRSSCLTPPLVTGGAEDVFLPAVHGVTGKQIQWDIFSRQMNSALPKVCASLNVNLTHAQHKLTECAQRFQ